MSQVATRLDHEEAVAVAERFVALLAGTYDRLEIAGSIRRGAPTVGDIEIVAVPSLVAGPADLFGAPPAAGPVDLLAARMATLAADGTVEPRLRTDGSRTWGPLAKYLIFQNVRIDLFTPCAERWGWILLLRTGPEAFARQLVVEVGRRTKDGRLGLLPAYLKPRDGWLTSRVSGERIETPEEETVFGLFRRPWIPPQERV